MPASLLPLQSMARSHQHGVELQRALDASEREVQRLVKAQMEVSWPRALVPDGARGVSGLSPQQQHGVVQRVSVCPHQPLMQVVTQHLSFATPSPCSPPSPKHPS